MSDPVWVTKARAYVGTKEIPGPKTNPIIQRLLQLIKAPWRDDETPWCGSFVAGVMTECNIASPKNPWAALNWATWGTALKNPIVGAVAVKRRKGGGHVGIVVGADQHGNLWILGGNQGDAVTIRLYPRDAFFTFRWPPGRAKDAFELYVINSDTKSNLASTEA